MLIDGLIASTAPEVLVPEARRLRLVVLVHMPLGDRPSTMPEPATRDRERSVSAAAAVVTTASGPGSRLLDRYGCRPTACTSPSPASTPPTSRPGTASGGELLCVAAVTPHKGHDVLLDALATIADLSWRCVCVGSLDRDPAFVDGLRRRAVDAGSATGCGSPGRGPEPTSTAAYAAADLLVLASRAETYGMVVTEALARGLPVVAAEVGGLPEALGRGADGIRPGLLVPPDDPARLGAALRAWLTDAELRRTISAAPPASAATSLSGWSATTSAVASVLAGAAR